jgi:hypothetical protein
MCFNKKGRNPSVQSRENDKIDYRLARKACIDFNVCGLCKMTICHYERFFTVSPPAPSTCVGCPPKRTIL